MSEAFFTGQPSSSEIKKRMEGFPSWIEVDLDAVGHNLEQVKLRTGREIIPCVKGNAYGHGLVPVVAYMVKKGVKRVLVAKLYEAEQIREAGLGCGIVCLDPLFSTDQYETVVRLGITPAVYRIETAEQLSRAAGRVGKPSSIWVKVDTGLGRVGVRWTDAVDFVEKVSRVPNVKVDGVFSTLSENAELDREQVTRMEHVCAELKKRGVSYGTVSMASSNAIFQKPYAFLDAVRPGLMLYGFYPDKEDREAGITLRPALCLKARIEQVKTVEAGESLTYSRRFVADRRMPVGTAHIGYGDGFPRGLTKKGLVKVGGVIKPLLGTVSVNHFLMDLTDTGAKVGDAVEAISREGENSAPKVAETAGIMLYSLAVGLSLMTPRVFFEGGEPVALSEPFLKEKV